MKHFILFVLFLPLLTTGQDSLLYNNLPVIDGRVTYEKIFNLDSIKKDALFLRAKDWAVNAYRSQKATLQAEDKEAGYIAYKGILPVLMTYNAGIMKGKKYPLDLYHTLKFYIKDGKLKAVFTDLSTVSKDFGNQFINETEPKPIEHEDAEVKKMKGKKRERYSHFNELWAREIDLHIQNFLVALGKDLQKGKSAFDF